MTNNKVDFNFKDQFRSTTLTQRICLKPFKCMYNYKTHTQKIDNNPIVESQYQKINNKKKLNPEGIKYSHL